MRILQIEADSGVALMLKSEGFNVFSTELGEEGSELARHYDYDLILLDLNLPDMSGMDVLRTLRVGKINTPIMILSGTSEIETKVKTFSGGADDYMTKPFHKDELVARIHAVVRRSKGHAQSVIKTGDITVNLDAKTVEVNGLRVHLTGKEYQMLELLSLRKGTTLTKEMFLNHLYGGMDEPELKIIDVFICKIRGKFKPLGVNHHIETVWGRGYVLVDEPEPRISKDAAPRVIKPSPVRDLIMDRLSKGAAAFPELAALRPASSLGSLRGLIARLTAERQIENIGTSNSAVYRLVAAEQGMLG